MDGTRYVLCARCSAVKEHQRRAFCDACQTDIAKWRLRDKYEKEALRPEPIRARNRAYKHRAKGLVATRPRPPACELCRTPEAELRRVLALDHCHKTGKFRGWLCFKCNTALGKFGDSSDGLRAALAYLERHEFEKEDE